MRDIHRVLILVVMDNSLVHYDLFHKSPKGVRVLILVVMDNSLVLKNPKMKQIKGVVS